MYKVGIVIYTNEKKVLHLQLHAPDGRRAYYSSVYP